MKDKETKKVEALISKATKNNRVYYNISVTIEGMKVQLQPKFLNNKQKGLLNHKIARLVGDENANKQTNKK